VEQGRQSAALSSSIAPTPHPPVLQPPPDLSIHLASWCAIPQLAALLFSPWQVSSEDCAQGGDEAAAGADPAVRGVRLVASSWWLQEVPPTFAAASQPAMLPCCPAEYVAASCLVASHLGPILPGHAWCSHCLYSHCFTDLTCPDPSPRLPPAPFPLFFFRTAVAATTATCGPTPEPCWSASMECTACHPCWAGG